MLVIGAKGFAKEVLDVLYQCNDMENLAFYDGISTDLPNLLYERFEVITNLDNAKKYFQNTDARFTIGIGNPLLRKKMYEKFNGLGGVFTSTISPFAQIGHFGNQIGAGCNIMNNALISNGVTLKEGVLVYYNSSIAHDCKIGSFVELSPSSTLLGGVLIGDYTHIGANATILPKVTIGKNVIVGAGSVVTKDIPDNCLVVGVPGVIKKESL
jgi:sugar O-acyltransferase (sialic acid O-acetyltransferase NeuD family)